ncbi:hypothetical protein [Micromonospora sp. DPT]|uniref:hypothetical protein n=1 Tax=Micromonospora sp. DPT TaxID=3142975 RepID=UPI00320906DC
MPAYEAVASAAPSPRLTAGTCPSKPQLAEALPNHLQVVGWSGGIHCAEGWALTGVDIADPNGEIDGQPAVNTEPRLFRTAGDRWVEVSREKSCQAGAVPDKIEELACDAS